MNFRLAVNDRDVVKGATHLVELHGTKAVEIAQRRGAQLRASGADDGAQIWIKTADLAHRMLAGSISIEAAVKHIDDELDDEIEDAEIDGVADVESAQSEEIDPPHYHGSKETATAI